MKKLFFLAVLSLAITNAGAQTIDETQTKQVFDFLFGKGTSAAMTIQAADKQKAIFFLEQLIESSCKMSLAKGLLDGALPVKTTISESVAAIVKAMIKSTYQDCYKGTMEGNFYESVRTSLARNWKSAFAIRKQTGEWI